MHRFTRAIALAPIGLGLLLALPSLAQVSGETELSLSGAGAIHAKHSASADESATRKAKSKFAHANHRPATGAATPKPGIALDLGPGLGLFPSDTGADSATRFQPSSLARGANAPDLDSRPAFDLGMHGGSSDGQSPASAAPGSASMPNFNQGHGMTIMLPLFSLLNKIPGPPPPD